MNDFQIHALPYEQFGRFFTMSDTDCAAARAELTIVKRTPGTPCRVSLQDAVPGETALLIHFVHQPAETPFHASHAIYVRQNAEQANLRMNEMPHMLSSRLLSLRAFNAQGMMLQADVTAGTEAGTIVGLMLADVDVSSVHIHNASHGCYLARATRPEDGARKT